MLRHLAKLVWNRKRSNGLIILEIFFCYLVVLAVATLGLGFWHNYRQPLGYETERVWAVTVERAPEGGGPPAPVAEPGDDGEAAEEAETAGVAFARLLRELEAQSWIESAAAASGLPYQTDREVTSLGRGGVVVNPQTLSVGDRFARTLGVEVAAGRWFDRTDAALAWTPLVIDRELAGRLFGGAEAVGERVELPGGRGEGRVIGVVDAFRRGGELSSGGPFVFQRLDLEAAGAGAPPYLAVRVAPGTGAEAEQRLVSLARGVARGWSFEVTPLTDLRTSSFRLRTVPLTAGALVASFLLLMVLLGLSGVMWQNIVRRQRELGLRRATGASAGDIRRQILLELVLLTSFGVAFGTLLALQVPLLDLVGPIPGGVLLGGLAASLTIVYLLALLCGFYPSWIATRVQPSEALRAE